MKLLFGLLGVFLFAGGTFYALQAGQAQDDDAAMAAFLQVVDVDGDGQSTAGDRAVVEWWCNNGGSFSALHGAAVDSDGVCDVQAYLESPDAQLGD